MQHVAQSEDRLIADKGTTILVQDIGEYAVDLLLTGFAPSGTWLQVQSDLRRRVVEEFQRRGLELAVPAYKQLSST